MLPPVPLHHRHEISALSTRHREVPSKHPLLARIDLIYNVARGVLVPRVAGILHDGRQHSLLQQSRLFERVDVQTGAHVPRDVAMEGPRAGVIGVVLQDNVCRVGRGATLD